MELFKAEERSIREILSKKEICYKIPRNQRDYVWEDKQWKEFLNDIIECIELNEQNEFVNTEYFIGSCVLEKYNKKVEFIVDGQQRLTTITIILSVLYDLFEEFKQNQLLGGIYSYLYKINDDGEEYFTIKNENLDPYYSESVLYKGGNKEFVEVGNEQQKRISRAFKYFYDEIKKYLKEYYPTEKDSIKYLIAFRNQLLGLKIIEISVNNEIDGYTVFEILNAKGKQLQLGDRMKNLILKKLPKTFPSDQAKAKWDKIKSNIEVVSKSENSFSDFLNHYWISTYEKLKDDDEIYHYFKSKISKGNMVDFLKDLEINSETYIDISLSKNNRITNELEFCLNSFKIFRNKQLRPVLMSLYHNYRSEKITYKELISYIRRLENFHFVFSAICSSYPNKVEKIYYQYSPILKNNFSKQIIENFFKELSSKKPEYTIFERNFFLKGYSHKNKDLKTNRSLVNYILQRVEYHKQGNMEFLINDISIEHIKNDEGVEITSMIGNLLPLSQSINANCGSESYMTKVSKYKSSNFQTVKDFLKYNSEKNEWEDKDIKERTQMLAKLAYHEIWK